MQGYLRLMDIKFNVFIEYLSKDFDRWYDYLAKEIRIIQFQRRYRHNRFLNFATGRSIRT